METILILVWAMAFLMGIGLVIFFNLDELKDWYRRNEGEIYLSLTIATIVCVLLTLDSVGIIKIN